MSESVTIPSTADAPYLSLCYFDSGPAPELRPRSPAAWISEVRANPGVVWSHLVDRRTGSIVDTYRRDGKGRP